jgi:hypothetical protein
MPAPRLVVPRATTESNRLHRCREHVSGGRHDVHPSQISTPIDQDRPSILALVCGSRHQSLIGYHCHQVNTLSWNLTGHASSGYEWQLMLPNQLPARACVVINESMRSSNRSVRASGTYSRMSTSLRFANAQVAALDTQMDARPRTLAEHEGGLWTTGRPDDPRGSRPGRHRRGSQASFRSPQSCRSSPCSLGESCSLRIGLGDQKLFRNMISIVHQMDQSYRPTN